MLKLAFRSLQIWKFAGGGYPQTSPYKGFITSSTGMKSSRTNFCSKSCKHLQVKDQTRWNSSQDEITHVNGSLKSMFRSGGFPAGLTYGSVIWRHFCFLFSNKEWPDPPENGGYFINPNKARNWLRHTCFMIKGAPPKAGRQKISLETHSGVLLHGNL